MNTMKMDRSNIMGGPTDQQIQARAYELYLARGGVAGDAQEDWLRAERELTEALTAASDESDPKAKKNPRDGARTRGGPLTGGEPASQRH